MTTEDEDKLIVEYELLRRRMRRLEAELERVDSQLSILETWLPEGYVYPGDPPQSGGVGPTSRG